MIELSFQRYRLFPYERDLALRELASLGLRVVNHDDTCVVASGSADVRALQRLTYFSEIRSNGSRIEPSLAGIERRHLERKRHPQRPRQATRYLVHGLHEYKGKFHPHLVRAFANLMGVRNGDLLIDPFAGSGTTLVEALMLGCDAVGLDRSPIAVRITEAKLTALATDDRARLVRQLDTWSAAALQRIERSETMGSLTAQPQLESESLDYLERWFPPESYTGLLQALTCLDEVRSEEGLYRIASVALSSVLRDASLQAPEDLRIRRRRGNEVPPPLAILLRGALAAAKLALQETSELEPITNRWTIREGDAAEPGSIRDLRCGAARATVITSPPYATALPYVDTDRLSLVALGLMTPPGLRDLEATLIGSREWRGAEERRWMAALDANTHQLPRPIVEICRRVVPRPESPAGFRRRAVPGLLYRYFAMMDGSFREVRSALMPGERAVIIVGVNRTGRGSDATVVDTPDLLGRIAVKRGFRVDELIALNTWPRYGLHHQNGVKGETAVLLTAQ